MLKTSNVDILNTMEKGPILRSLFSNGACYTFHQAKGFSGAKVNLSFLAGSIFESREEQGIAHLLEHLMFKETATKRIYHLEKNGAELNAYTYKETVSFEMECHKDNLDNLLPDFLDHFLNLDFNEDQFIKEKQVVLHELKEDEDDHEAQGIEELFSQNFSFDIAHPVGGKLGQVKKITSEQIRNYFSKYFTPQRLILTIVSGKKSDYTELLQQKMLKYFTGKKRSPIRLALKKKRRALVHSKKVKHRKMESSISYFSFDGPKVNDGSYYDFVVLDELLFEGLSSYFFKRLREDEPLVYGMGSALNSFHHSGQYLMIFTGSVEKAKRLKKIVTQGLNDFLDVKLCAQEIEKIKKRLIQNWELSFDLLDERLEFLLDQEIYEMQHKTIGQMRAELRRVDGKSIQKALKKMYKDHSYLLYKNRGR